MRFYCYSYRAKEKGAELRLKHKADHSTELYDVAGNFDAPAKVYCKSMEALLFTSIDLKKRTLLEQKIIRYREKEDS